MNGKIYLYGIFIFCLAAIFLARTESHKSATLGEITVGDTTTFATSIIKGYMNNNGSIFYDSRRTRAGLVYPKWRETTVVFYGGLWLGAKINGEIHAAVSDYIEEFAPGKIDFATHQPDDPENPRYRIYTISPDSLNSPDYLNWPVEDGAPVKSGKPMILGDQTLWCVYNDADSAVHTSLHSKPLGAEVQQTVFARDNNYQGANKVVFLRYLIINKSAAVWDSAYIGFWTDPDVGDPDDKSGFDTTTSMGYAYNYVPYDSDYGDYPPAVGFLLLAGPVVESPGDTAFFNWKIRPGYRNLPLFSFVSHRKGMGINGSVNNPQHAYNYLRGRWKDGSPITYGGDGTDPNNPPVRFMYTGDPVTNSGWVQQYGDDVRFLLSCGPLTMAPGDSQEVILAVLVARGTDYLDSVSRLKALARSIRRDFPQKTFLLPSKIGYQTSYLSAEATTLHFWCFNPDELSIQGELFVYGENGNPDTLLQRFNLLPLSELHDFPVTGEFLYGATIDEPFHRNGGYLNLILTTDGEDTLYFPRVIEKIPLIGELQIVAPIIGSDNLNNDGEANWGENVRFTLRLQNNGPYEIENLKLSLRSTSAQNYALSAGQSGGMPPPLEDDTSFPILIDAIPGHSTYEWPYTPGEPNFYFDSRLKKYPPQDVQFRFYLEDSHRNSWHRTTAIHIKPFLFLPEYDTTRVVQGDIEGTMQYVMVDPLQLKNHTYQVQFIPRDHELQYQLLDVTTNELKLTNQPLPDAKGHNSTLVDGFKLLKGRLEYEVRLEGSQFKTSAQNRWLEKALFFKGYTYWALLGSESEPWQSTLGFWEYPDLKIVFDSTQTTFCKVYRKDLNYAIQSGLGIFNGAAYDVRYPGAPRRLNVVLIENDTVKAANMRWDPDTTLTGGEEILVIMNSDYDSLTAGGYDNNNFALSADVLIQLALRLKEGKRLFQVPEELTLKMNKTRPHPDVVFEFTPRWKNPSELEFRLQQNYPNPFNAVTTIEYRIIKPGPVKLQIFDILGRRVATLYNGHQEAGTHLIQWDGRNHASGIYFYRLDFNNGEFVKTRKMLLIK